MATVRPFAAPQVDDPAQVIERLGWAVIRQWADLSPSTRLLLSAQASLTSLAGNPPVQMAQLVNAFIRAHAKSSDA